MKFTAAQIKKGVSLHKGQTQVYLSTARFKVVGAGRRWGKTKLAITMLIKKSAKPRQKVWYIAPSYRMANMIIWDDLKESVPKRWIKKINETKMQIRLRNGSIIECKGADDPDSLRGVGLNYVVLDEFQDMKEDVWKKVLRPTLAKDRGHAMFIGTPKGFANLYDVYKLGQNPKNRIWQSWQFKTSDSPFIPAEEIAAARADLDPKAFRQEFEASFESMSGRVYHAFDRKTHVQDVEFDPDLPIWIGKDFNIDPMTCVFMQFDKKTGLLKIFDEIYMNNSNTEEVCDEIERRYWEYMQQIVVYPDPAGGNKSHARGESSLDIMREKGMRKIKFRRKHPFVRDRVAAVNRQFCDANGRVSIYIDPSCEKLIESLEQTMYKEGTSDIDKAADVEHITDALGYPVEFEFPTKKIVIAGLSL